MIKNNKLLNKNGYVHDIEKLKNLLIELEEENIVS